MPVVSVTSVTVCVCVGVCLCVRTLKGKRLELSTSNRTGHINSVVVDVICIGTSIQLRAILEHMQKESYNDGCLTEMHIKVMYDVYVTCELMTQQTFY